MDEYYEIAKAMSIATGREIEFDPEKFAYFVVDGGDRVIAGYADEDVVEIVGSLLRL